jgi:hypothetical protein
LSDVRLCTGLRWCRQIGPIDDLVVEIPHLNLALSASRASHSAAICEVVHIFRNENGLGSLALQIQRSDPNHTPLGHRPICFAVVASSVNYIGWPMV